MAFLFLGRAIEGRERQETTDRNPSVYSLFMRLTDDGCLSTVFLSSSRARQEESEKETDVGHKKELIRRLSTLPLCLLSRAIKGKTGRDQEKRDQATASFCLSSSLPSCARRKGEKTQDSSSMIERSCVSRSLYRLVPL